mgnify:FL=1
MLVLIIIVMVAHNIYLQLQMDSTKVVVRALLRMMDDDE